MVQELRTRHQARQLYVHALSSAWRSNVRLYEPSIWLGREPELVDKLLLDADVHHAVRTRQHMIAGKSWQILPRDPDSAAGDLVASICTDALRDMRGFTEARQMLARAFLDGFTAGRIVGSIQVKRYGDGTPRRWWVPSRFQHIDPRSLEKRAVRDDDGKPIGAVWQRWDVAESKWVEQTEEDALQTIMHRYADEESTLGYGRGLRDALAWWWYAKTEVFGETLNAVERFAQGIIHAQVDGLRDANSGAPNPELVKQWQKVLEDVRGRHTVVSDSSDSIEILNAPAQGWELMRDIRAEIRSTIMSLVLGANLPTTADDGGSYALAEVQENSTEAIVQSDRESLDETLTDDLLGCILAKNRRNFAELGVADALVDFTSVQEKRHDPQERAAVATSLSALGVPLSLDDIYEQTGMRKPDDGEDLVPGPAQPDPFGGFDLPGLSATEQGAGPLPDLTGTLDAADTPDAPQEEPAQDSALNGAQVTAAADIIDRVVQKTMPAGTAKLMLVTMFNLDPSVADQMIQEAQAFQPAPDATPLGSSEGLNT